MSLRRMKSNPAQPEIAARFWAAPQVRGNIPIARKIVLFVSQHTRSHSHRLIRVECPRKLSIQHREAAVSRHPSRSMCPGHSRKTREPACKCAWDRACIDSRRIGGDHRLEPPLRLGTVEPLLVSGARWVTVRFQRRTSFRERAISLGQHFLVVAQAKPHAPCRQRANSRPRNRSVTFCDNAETATRMPLETSADALHLRQAAVSAWSNYGAHQPSPRFPACRNGYPANAPVQAGRIRIIRLLRVRRARSTMRSNAGSAAR